MDLKITKNEMINGELFFFIMCISVSLFIVGDMIGETIEEMKSKKNK